MCVRGGPRNDPYAQFFLNARKKKDDLFIDMYDYDSQYTKDSLFNNVY